MEYKHLFGPVPSRRLGVSLGIDLVPLKTCTLNCVYCECGRTTNLTVERKEYVSTDEIFDELNGYLGGHPDLDFITFSGSGEPTLHSCIGDITSFLKQNYPQYKVAVLTNGTLFYQKELRDEVKNADLIVPSLDAASESTFKKINRPHPSLSCRKIISGLTKLRKEYSGKVWLEIFIVPGLNDTKSELQLLKRAIQKINPDKVQLNTLDRPGTESWVKPAKKAKLEEISSYLGNAKIASKFVQRRKIASFSKDLEENILSTIRRRPCTAKDLSQILGLHLNEVTKYLQALLEAGKIESEELERGIFFKPKKR
jgi:wyosine [tRNA(Phe)-imidazoG37] synthetase (radical SAM superfamily)